MNKNTVAMLAHAGYAARGVVFAIIGLFAILSVFGRSDQTGSKGALQNLLDQPFGTILVWLMIIGFIGYALWRFTQSLADTDDHGTDPKGLVIRAGLVSSGITYGLLALYSLSMLGVVGSSSDGGSLADSINGTIAKDWILVIPMLVFAGVAVAHFIKAGSQKYQKWIEPPADMKKLVDVVAIIGLVARGLVFVIFSLLIGFKLASGSNQQADTNPGMKEALEFVQGLPMGGVLLAIMGMGLIAFAAYSFTEALWRRIDA